MARYVFKHTEADIDVYSPEAGNWVPFRDGTFATDDQQLAEWIALLRDPNITLPKALAPDAPSERSTPQPKGKK